ncbi:hypothetical protein [Listeria fleischmannii]|uniref:Uncharacterized protein n=1 Tax=Listeria fleischmannii FSL S10-1203 TaxID=1265822 RepID=W7DY44_9LIST|nr:hypothetical protein [Listeria fleischmannii]EUJ53840.1 hypothetical protein MCOL2_10545 [Listeria fleischmannii FSL S10-1203]
MADVAVRLEEGDLNILHPLLVELAKNAFEEGVKFASDKMQYEKVLTNEDLAKIFGIAPATVSSKVIKYPDFPKIKDFQAKYPRDEVFKWIDNGGKLSD